MKSHHHYLKLVQTNANILHFLFSLPPPFWLAETVMNSQFLTLISADPYFTYTLSARWSQEYTDNSHNEKEDGTEHILRMSLQSILDTTAFIDLKKLAWMSLCPLWPVFVSLFQKHTFFLSIFPIVLWVKRPYILYVQLWNLSLHDE